MHFAASKSSEQNEILKTVNTTKGREGKGKIKKKDSEQNAQDSRTKFQYTSNHNNCKIN